MQSTFRGLCSKVDYLFDNPFAKETMTCRKEGKGIPKITLDDIITTLSK